jgi:sugar lactone lactonase YvrE
LSSKATGWRLLVLASAATIVCLAAAAPAGAVIGAGEIIVAGSSDDDALIVVDPRTGQQRLFAASGAPINSGSQFLEQPVDVVVSPSGRLYVANHPATPDSAAVVAVDPSTGKQTLVSSNAQPVNATSQFFNNPTGIALLPDSTIVVSDRNFGGVIAVDPDTGKQSVFSSNDQPVNAGSQLFSDLRGGITVQRSGTVLVGSNGGPAQGVIAVDPATGQQSRFSTNDQPVNASSQLYDIPVGVVEALSGRVFVADQNGPTSASPGYFNGGVIGVNPATGGQSEVSHNSQPVNSGSAYFADPFDITFGLDGKLLVLDADAFSAEGCGFADPGCGGVISVDPVTGRQRILSSNDQPVNASRQFFGDEFGFDVMPPRCSGKLATIVGTTKSETIVGTAGADVIATLAGRDKVFAKTGGDRVCTGTGADLARGGKGRDRIRGEGGPDRLFGGARRDLLFGGKGVDLLKGGPGRDLLRGGPGRDARVQ